MLIVHHNDADGHLGGFICSLKQEVEFKNIKFYEYDYSKLPVISENEKVIFVDCSMNLSQIDEWKNLFKRSKNILYIDHHKSSIDIIKDNPDIFNGNENFVSDLGSGAMLAYIWFFEANQDKKEAFSILINESLKEDFPKVVRTVDDFDRWVHKFQYSKAFIKGLDAYDTNPGTAEGFVMWSNLFHNDSKVDNVIDKGNIILKAYKKMWKKWQDKFAYEVEIENSNNQPIKAIVINADSYSDCFGELYNEYDACILWNMNKDKKYEYSVYSKDPSKFNSKEYAEKYGGGGHPGASGFTIDKLLF